MKKKQLKLIYQERINFFVIKKRSEIIAPLICFHTEKSNCVTKSGSARSVRAELTIFFSIFKLVFSKIIFTEIHGLVHSGVSARTILLVRSSSSRA